MSTEEALFKGSMFTVILSHSATGEGSFKAVMYTRGYGQHYDRRKNALENFESKYGPYYAMGAEVHDGMVFDFHGRETLVSDKAVELLKDFAVDAGGLEYTASLHFNFS